MQGGKLNIPELRTWLCHAVIVSLVFWSCVGTTGCQPSPRESLGSPLWSGDRSSVDNDCKGEHQDSDFFSCTCFALNIMESKILQRFTLRISVVELKSVENFAACLSLPCLFCFPNVRTRQGDSTFMLKQKVFVCVP